jgi:predicted  nucleic acid-binding Zn-ribbon protein
MSLINQIILLQEVDNKLFEIEKLLGDLPSKVQKLTQNEDGVKTSLQNKENELKEASVLISTNETLVETTLEKINSLKDKLIDGSISTNKEYDAMMETIDFEKNLLSEKENELIELMSKKEELSKEIEEDKASLDGIITELKTKKDDLNVKMQEVSEENNALKIERDNIAKDISEDIMETYVQIFNARKGVACSEILDNNCEGCGAYIPPQLVNEALSQEIVNCGTCSRFLYKSENNTEN